MADKINGVDPNVNNPNHPGPDEAPVDPSNTSSIGQKVEQGVVDVREGISKQASRWEDEQERGKVEELVKKPSQEER